MLSCYQQFQNFNNEQIIKEQMNPNQIYSTPYINACANICSNITYDLKSCEYQNVKFFNSSTYSFKNNLAKY